MMAVWWVALGGALGSASRYAISMLMPVGTGFPWATLFINTAACFVLGWSVGRAAGSPWRKYGLEIGFCGGFSTFSTFSKEVFALMQQQHWGGAVLYVLASNVLGLAAFAGGWWLGRGGGA